MRRILALVVTVLMVVAPLSRAISQSNRYRMPTGYDQDERGPAPSFRGADGEKSGVSSSDMQMPRSLMQGSMGKAEMMGAGYQVHVLGDVMRPGTYIIMASERLSSVIQQAGGIAENGSERRIELRRKGGGSRTIDLLRFRLFGQLADNPYLMDNDVVFVPLRKKVVQVAGAIGRPDFYELKDEKTLADVVDLAGGFNAAVAKGETIRVVRFVDGEKRVETVPTDRSDMAAFSIDAGDVIIIPNLVTKGTEFDYNVSSIPGDQIFYPSYEDRVFVLGGVSFPGAYPFSPYYTINQYVSLAGGLSDRGVSEFTVTRIDGKTGKAKPNERVNPGDTIMIKERIMSPAAWAGFALAIASFGLSASATIIALRR